MHSPTVILSRCSDYSLPGIAEAIERQFKLLGGLEKFVSPGDTVLLKPNFIAPRHRRCATQTDPAVILETARLLKDFGARPFVGDSPAWGNVSSCIRKLKLEGPLKKLDVPVKQLNKPVKCKIGTEQTVVGISSAALDADVIINLPKFKAHQQLIATFAVKNMFGAVTGKKKAYWHFARGASSHDFCKFLIEVYRFLNPALTIVDGILAMDGPGPIRGRARKLGVLVGSADPIACELVCARLVKVDANSLPIVQAARGLGFGPSDFEHIEVVGDGLSGLICEDFVIPPQIPVKFSLLRIFKSICKQMLLLAKTSIKKRIGR